MISAENLRASLKKHLADPSLKIAINSEWGSHNPEYRSIMKNALQNIQGFMDPAQHQSTSHCQALGIAVSSQYPIGIDVELSSRVTEAVVSRISASDEHSKAPPDRSALWCAKEACFKSLQAYQQPAVISAITVGDWKNIDSQIETFRLINAAKFDAPSNNTGVVIKSSLHTYAFFVFYS